jgi:hypothetical protein
VVLLEWAAVREWVLVTSMTWRLYCTGHGIQRGREMMGKGGYSQGLGEWAAVREQVLVTSMTWQLCCTLRGVQRATWGDGGRYLPGLHTRRRWAVAVVDRWAVWALSAAGAVVVGVVVRVVVGERSTAMVVVVTKGGGGDQRWWQFDVGV